MGYRKVAKGHYVATIPRTFNSDIVIHLVKNDRSTTYTGTKLWQVIVDDSLINVGGKKEIGAYSTYKLAKKHAKIYVEDRLLEFIERQLEMIDKPKRKEE